MSSSCVETQSIIWSASSIVVSIDFYCCEAMGLSGFNRVMSTVRVR